MSNWCATARRRDAGDQAVERAQLGLTAKVVALEEVVSEHRLSPYLPPSSSWNATAAFGSAFFGAGNSVLSLSIRRNIILHLMLVMVNYADPPEPVSSQAGTGVLLQS
jgi:hypothetical protein